MMDAVVIAMFWAIALTCYALGPRALIYLLFCSAPFGSLAVVPTALTAGLTFTPMPISALLLIVRVLVTREGVGFLLASSSRPNPLALMAAFWAIAVVATLFMPRLFAGNVMVVPVRVIEGNLAPLYPNMQNISQLFYLTISILVIFAAAFLLGRPSIRATTVKAILASAVVLVATGLLDLASEHVPLDWLLESFRTATYALMTEAEVLGARRVVGLMPEASAFGSVCVRTLAFLYFFRHAMEEGSPGRWLNAAMIGALVVMIYLSTSSAAYVGLAVFALLAGMEWAWRAIMAHDGQDIREVKREGAFALLATLAVVIVLISSPGLVSQIMLSADEIVFNKTETSSFAERNLWTATAWQATLDTYGLGVGLGGTRASNSWIALISNVGVAGAFFYFLFMIVCYFQSPAGGRRIDRAMLRGCRWGLMPGIVVGLLVGTTADFGVFVGFIYGLMLAIGGARSHVRTVEKSGPTIDPAPSMLRYRGT